MLSREDETARLALAMRAAADGHGSLVVVTGPPGIGKTTLLGAAQSAAGDADLLVRRARGVELERSFPLGVVRQPFERPLAEAGPLCDLPQGRARARPLRPGRDGVAARVDRRGRRPVDPARRV